MKQQVPYEVYLAHNVVAQKVIIEISSNGHGIFIGRNERGIRETHACRTLKSRHAREDHKRLCCLTSGEKATTKTCSASCISKPFESVVVLT